MINSQGLSDLTQPVNFDDSDEQQKFGNLEGKSYFNVQSSTILLTMSLYFSFTAGSTGKQTKIRQSQSHLCNTFCSIARLAYQHTESNLDCRGLTLTA